MPIDAYPLPSRPPHTTRRRAVTVISRRHACVFGLSVAVGRSAAGTGLRHVRPGATDRVGHYTVELINLALQRLGQPPLMAEDWAMSDARIARELRDPQGQLDAMWGMSLPATEAALTPVRFALDRGLLGYRLLLVRTPSLAAWQRVLQQPPTTWPMHLQQQRCGSGEHWPDTHILRANGWNLRTTTRHGSLFRMLAADRIDIFPRSSLEILPELEAHRGHALTVLPQLAVAYPAVSYFYLSPRHAHWAEPLRRTLLALAADGTVSRLFDHHFGTELSRLSVAQRQVVWLRNPFRSAEQPAPVPPIPWLQPPAGWKSRTA